MRNRENAATESQSTLAEILKTVGVENGETVLVHSDTTMAMTLSDTANWNDALQYQLDNIRQAIGDEGTLIVPTFTYAFCSGTPYIHEHSRSEVGMFSNYVLAQADAVRSFHPIFSFAAIGPRAVEICENVSSSAFGIGSVLERLYLTNDSIVFINTSFDRCTFVHHVEETHGVDYRYKKIFTGDMERDGMSEEGHAEYYVRDLDLDLVPQFNALTRVLIRLSLMRETVTPAGSVLRVKCEDVYRQAWKMLDDNPASLVGRTSDSGRR